MSVSVSAVATRGQSSTIINGGGGDEQLLPRHYPAFTGPAHTDCSWPQSCFLRPSPPSAGGKASCWLAGLPVWKQRPLSRLRPGGRPDLRLQGRCHRAALINAPGTLFQPKGPSPSNQSCTARASSSLTSQNSSILANQESAHWVNQTARILSLHLQEDRPIRDPGGDFCLNQSAPPWLWAAPTLSSEA